MKYRDPDYFNNVDTYMVKGTLRDPFESKAKLNERGRWYFIEGVRYICTSVPCINKNELTTV